MSPVFWAAAHAKALLQRVEFRLTEAGAVIELDQFHNLGADEVDVLLWLERNEPVAICAPSDPQAIDGGVAA